MKKSIFILIVFSTLLTQTVVASHHESPELTNRKQPIKVVQDILRKHPIDEDILLTTKKDWVNFIYYMTYVTDIEVFNTLKDHAVYKMARKFMSNQLYANIVRLSKQFRANVKNKQAFIKLFKRSEQNFGESFKSMINKLKGIESDKGRYIAQHVDRYTYLFLETLHTLLPFEVDIANDEYFGQCHQRITAAANNDKRAWNLPYLVLKPCSWLAQLHRAHTKHMPETITDYSHFILACKKYYRLLHTIKKSDNTKHQHLHFQYITNIHTLTERYAHQLNTSDDFNERFRNELALISKKCETHIEKERRFAAIIFVQRSRRQFELNTKTKLSKKDKQYLKLHKRNIESQLEKLQTEQPHSSEANGLEMDAISEGNLDERTQADDEETLTLPKGSDYFSDELKDNRARNTAVFATLALATAAATMTALELKYDWTGWQLYQRLTGKHVIKPTPVNEEEKIKVIKKILAERIKRTHDPEMIDAIDSLLTGYSPEQRSEILLLAFQEIDAI